MKTLLLTLCTALLAAGCVNTSTANRPRPPLEVMMDAPDFELTNVLGGSLKSDELKGKVVVVDLWATWCVPCKVEIPHYNDLRAKLKDRGVEFVGITLESGTAEDVKETVEELEMQYPVVMATDEVVAGFGGQWAFPTTLLVGKDWKVYRKIVGVRPTKISDLEADIEDLLAAEL